VRAWADRHCPQDGDEAYRCNIALRPPSDLAPYYWATLFVFSPELENPLVHARWRASDGGMLRDRQKGVAYWLRDFHRDLMWADVLGGRTVGRALVGLGGIVMLLAVLSGILIHRKLLSEWFTYRRQRSPRLKWKDAHNVIGLWGLPFHVMIAFTGAFIGIVALLLPVMGFLVAKGDTDGLMAALGFDETAHSGVQAQMLNWDEALARHHPQTGAGVELVSVNHWGDDSARALVIYSEHQRLSQGRTEEISFTTGALQPGGGLDADHPVQRVLTALTPLHYGTYGGVSLKLLYFVLGLSLAMMCLLGIWVWLARRRETGVGQRSAVFYLRIERFSSGVAVGLLYASLAVIYFDTWYRGDEYARLRALGGCFFISWICVVIVAWVTPSPRVFIRLGLLLLALLLVVLPVIDLLTLGGAVLVSNATVGAFYCSFLFLAALCCWGGYKLQS
jgi:uncharacterized iron-regulated membrane protein